MSGIVGIINLDGEPIEPHLLGRMTDYMTFRGPDDRQIWIDGHVGFGHTMLRTTWEAEYERQPFTLDRQVWIVADARIDDRDTLAEKLGIPFQPLRGAASLDCAGLVTDVEFILQAYLKWGEACVEHLLGDFAFAIWDGRKQRLFCARDHFGVKLFYYSRVGNCLIFSNTLNCIRQHPLVSSELNEAAIGDFLLFDRNQNLETTTFVDIQKLAPAHTLIATNELLTTRRYWTLPLPDPIRYPNSRDYIDRFQELIGVAVGDRLRTTRAGISFSGGLDSTTIAANALDFATRTAQSLDLQAFTVVYDRLIPDRERYYSGIAAKSLAIPIHYLSVDDYQLYGCETSPNYCHTPEPYHNPLSQILRDNLHKVASHSRIFFNGEGADGALTASTLIDAYKYLPIAHLLADLHTCLFEYQLRPPVGSKLLVRLRRWGSRPSPVDNYTFPDWLAPGFSARHNLAERWQQIDNTPRRKYPHPRSTAYVAMSDTFLWSSFLEIYDPGFTHIPIEIRMPFLDLRLVNYLLSLPPIPWCVSKQIMRSAMQSRLPPAISGRPKTPLASSPYFAMMETTDRNIDWISKTPIDNFIDLNILQQTIDRQLLPLSAWQLLRSLSLGHWLSSNF